MASNYTGVNLAKADTAGKYKKVRMFFNGTGGLDTSAGGKFVALSGHGVEEAAASADVFGIVFEAVASAASTYVDVYCGLQDLFTAILVSSTTASANVNGQGAYLHESSKLAVGTAGLDIVGTLQDNTGERKTAGDRVTFSLTPSEAIAGYDSGNTA